MTSGSLFQDILQSFIYSHHEKTLNNRRIVRKLPHYHLFLKVLFQA